MMIEMEETGHTDKEKHAPKTGALGWGCIFRDTAPFFTEGGKGGWKPEWP